MLTYNNDPKFKEAFVAQAMKHEKEDLFLQGTYGTQNGHWRGCSVACSLRSLDLIQGKKKLAIEYNDHARFERDGLWPEWLARLQDTIFEGLPTADAIKWTAKLARAVPVGVDITPVKWKFCAYLMRENIERVLSLDISEALKTQVVDAIRQVLAVHESAVKTGEWDESTESAESAAWSAARSAAWSVESAAESAAWSVESAAWSAARSAAWSVESAARSAAWSVESAAWSVESAARSAAIRRYAKELLRLLKEADHD